MPIPALDARGLLPVGVHQCSLDEIRAAFCWNPHRTRLLDGLEDFIAQRWSPLNIQADLWIDGSFTRRKDLPDDIDVVADVSHVADADMLPVILLHYANASNKADFHVDFWFRHPMYPYDLAAFFQYTGLKAAAELSLDAKHPKGILKVTL